IAGDDGQRRVLKFINTSEELAETEMQIAVLRHLEKTDIRVAIPHHQPACVEAVSQAPDRAVSAGAKNGICDWIQYWPETNSHPIRVRAYGFLDGHPGSELET